MQIFKTQNSLFLIYGLSLMRGIVAGFTDKSKPLQIIISDYISEFICTHQSNKCVLIGHNERIINRVHPFDSKFHSTSAIDYTCSNVNMQHFLRCNSHISKTVKLFFFFQEIKVSHKCHLYLSSTYQLNFYIMLPTHQSKQKSLILLYKFLQTISKILLFYQPVLLFQQKVL